MLSAVFPSPEFHHTLLTETEALPLLHHRKQRTNERDCLESFNLSASVPSAGGNSFGIPGFFFVLSFHVKSLKNYANFTLFACELKLLFFSFVRFFVALFTFSIFRRCQLSAKRGS